jgi:hypothetical protein
LTHEHRWFEDRALMCTAIVYVDDATSRLMVVRFAGSESTFAYFEATREYLTAIQDRLVKELLQRISTIEAAKCVYLIFAWQELRRLTQNLTLHYERKLYFLPDTPETRLLIGRYLDVYQYPEGRIEIRTGGKALPYSTYDKLGAIDHGAIVENKRLGHVPQIVQKTQALRFSRKARRRPGNRQHCWTGRAPACSINVER